MIPNADPRAVRSRRREREDATRARLLEAAEQEFAACGYEDARIHGIAERARLAVGTLYAQFEGKQDLHLAVHALRLEQLFAAVAGEMVEQERAVDSLREGLAGLVRFFCAHPAYLEMHLRDGQAWSSHEQLRTDLQRESWQRGLDMMIALFARAAADGDLVSRDPPLDVRLVIAAMQVHLSAWLREQPRSSAEQQFEKIWDFVRRAFLAPSAQPSEERNR